MCKLWYIEYTVCGHIGKARVNLCLPSCETPEKVSISRNCCCSETCNKADGHVQTLKRIDDEIALLVQTGGPEADKNNDISRYNIALWEHRNIKRIHDACKETRKDPLPGTNQPTVDVVYEK
jgi:hypothetical protein